MSNKQSSVDWLIDKIHFMLPSYLIDKAKELHKKETIDFALHCMMPKMNPDKSTIEVVSDIYDEVFGGDQ